MTGPVLSVTLSLREMPPTGSEADLEMRVGRVSLLLFLGSTIQAPLPRALSLDTKPGKSDIIFKASPLCHRSGFQSYQQPGLFSVFMKQLSISMPTILFYLMVPRR